MGRSGKAVWSRLDCRCLNARSAQKALWTVARHARQCAGVQLQLYATWIFYAVLTELCSDVAVALSQPLERISVEMVFRSLYFFNRARLRQPTLQLIPWLVEHQRSMGLVKAVRQRQRRTASQSLDIWLDALT